MVVGELSLDGSVLHALGLLPMATAAREHGLPRLFEPQSDSLETSSVEAWVASSSYNTTYFSSSYRPCSKQSVRPRLQEIG